MGRFRYFSSCDSVFFVGRSKETAQDVWNVFPDCTISSIPQEVDDTAFNLIQQDATLLYDRTFSDTYINISSQDIFPKKDRSVNDIMPTKPALSEHIKLVACQASHTWAQSLTASPLLLLPEDWGWEKHEGGGWKPDWTCLPQASVGVQAILKCG